LNKSQTEECLFCTLPKENADRENLILYRGQHAFVILNRYPYSNGHLMVVCFRHVGHLSELSEEEAGEVMTLVTRCEKALLDAYKPGGLNVGVNMGRSAGAGILDHLHVHLVPRWHGDTNFMTSVGEARVVSEDLADSFTRLQPFFVSE
jgi:ATP adenylyltransferase